MLTLSPSWAASADHHGVEGRSFGFQTLAHGHAGLFAITVHRHDFLTVAALHAQSLAGGGKAAGELVDVARGVALGEVAAVEGSGQGRLYGAHLLRCHGAALQTAFGQQPGNLARMFKACSVAVDMQDAFLLQIEVNAFAGCPVKQVLACRNRQPGGLHGVFLVMGDGSEKLAEPGNLVPAGLGVEQQRSIALAST